MNINEILEKLESSLNEVDSARKQVDETVKAYKSLEKEIEDYSSTLKDVSDGVEGILNSISTHKTETLSELNKQLKKIQGLSDSIEEEFNKSSTGLINEFKKKLKTELSTLDGCNEDLKTNLGKIENIKTALEEKIDSLSNFQTSVDESFKKDLAQLETIVKKLDTLQKETSSISTKVSGTDDKVVEIQSQNVKSASEISEELNNLKKQNKTNSLVLFVILAVTVLSLIIMFLK